MRNLLLIFLMSALLFSCGNGSSGKLVEPVKYRLEVVAEYPHSRTSYTQGLFFRDGQLYESTGQRGESRFGKMNLQTGELESLVSLEDRYFGEGCCFFDGRLYYLTWRGFVACTYDENTFAHKGNITCPREGWGLTTDGKSLIMSDGSSSLWFMDAKLKTLRRISVKSKGKSVGWLNELEWIDGKIWANVYTTDKIVIINPENGIVEGIVDCTGLLDESLRDNTTDVLNGIAWNPSDGKIYLTGKNWPRIFEVRIVPE